MTSAQITNIFEEIKKAFGVTEPLDVMKKIKKITFTSVQTVYPSSYVKINFDTTNELLKLTDSSGAMVMMDFGDINGVFVYPVNPNKNDVTENGSLEGWIS